MKKKNALSNYTPISTESYLLALDNNKEYSLEIDPEDKYDFSEEEKSFIRNYIEFRDIAKTAALSNIEINKALTFYNSYNIKQEIKRLTKALYQRQFKKKILSIDELLSYLSSLIDDYELPESQKLLPKDKLKAAQLLIDIYQLKSTVIENPDIIDIDSIENVIKDLSYETILSLIENKDKVKDKKSLISEINKEGRLSDDELKYLNSLSYSSLLELLDSLNTQKENT